eukprot:gene17335-biopygen13223
MMRYPRGITCHGSWTKRARVPLRRDAFREQGGGTKLPAKMRPRVVKLFPEIDDGGAAAAEPRVLLPRDPAACSDERPRARIAGRSEATQRGSQPHARRPSTPRCGVYSNESGKTGSGKCPAQRRSSVSISAPPVLITAPSMLPGARRPPLRFFD